jgi:GNAT superfamily N-acetyltransferase
VLIERLKSGHERESFDCGEPTLNDYLRRFARQNDDKGLGRTFVAVEPGSAEIQGYYALSSGGVRFDLVPVNLPRYPVPVAHLGRLAVDLKHQGKRIGETLLLDALARAERAAEQLGIHAVEVVAIDDSARAFYLKYGFTPLLDDPRHLYLPMKTIRKLKLNGER